MPTLVHPSSPISSQMAPTTRAALGSSASLGDLYDARRDDFCGISIFKKAIPSAAITLRDAPFSEVALVHGDDYSDKFTKLNVNAELQASVLGGLFQLEGSGQYLNDQKKSARTVKSSLIYNIMTKEESVNIHHEELKKAFAIDAIQTGAATHVVVGISWGANSILTCQFENKENSDVTKIEGELSAQVKLLARSIKGKGDYNGQDSSSEFNFSVRMFGDVVAADDELPTTPEEALLLMKKMPSLVSSYNGGKGKAISYRLLPISALKPCLNCPLQADVLLTSLEESSLLRIVQFFDQMSNAKQLMHDFHKDAAVFSYCLAPEDYQKVMNLKVKIEIEEARLRSQLATVLTNVRSGMSDVAKIEELLQKFQESQMSPQNVAIMFSSWRSLLSKINFARTLTPIGVTYIGTGIPFDDELLKVYFDKVFVLYFSQNSGAEEPDRWLSNKQLFFKQVKDKQDKYLVVDLDLHPNLNQSNKTSFLRVFKEGQILTEDLLEEEQFLRSIPLVKTTCSVERVLHKPNQRVRLSISCPGDNCDPCAAYEWNCYKCKEAVDYAFDQYIYCSCGKTSTSSLEFRCSDPSHGLAFKRHDTAYLDLLLCSLRPMKEVNILILGESGVGKSTWINSFVNFIHYETLEEAANGELFTTIPTRFTVLNDNYEEVVVKTGDDANESQATGQSATQTSKVYPFTLGDTMLRLIDTPGIGDTRGVDQDCKNFENILGTLSYLDELHGICILLKPNNARLSVMFRFCIKELLTYLHKDASQNIVFCFTNSRGTFYKPGDTMPALRKLLSENQSVNLSISKDTAYCFDSESYRFLAALKNTPPISFTDSERQDFSFSWQKSMSETKRMIEHIRGLRPHKINSTLNLNFARKLVVKLSRPLSDITANIQRNKAVIFEEIEEIKGMNESIKELSKRKMMKRTAVMNTRIDFPKTVCTHSDCVEMHQLAGQGQKVAFYKRMCHAHCKLDGVQEEVIGHAKLMQCTAMNDDGTCRFCGHRYSVHAHIWYDSALLEEEVVDHTVVDGISQKQSAAHIKKAMIAKREREILEYESELKTIEKASIRFAYFLKTNAITPYNDAMEQYLQHLIDEEQGKLGTVKNRSPATLHGLQRSLSSYREQKEILEQEMQKGTSGEQPPTGADVRQLIDELQKLPHSGQALKDALDAVQFVEKVVYQEVKQKSESYGWSTQKSGKKTKKSWWQFLTRA